jgi:hypothetical protein
MIHSLLSVTHTGSSSRLEAKKEAAAALFCYKLQPIAF